MSTTRIYVVSEKHKPNRLIEAGSAAQAIRHCGRTVFSAKAAIPKDIAGMMALGHPVERAESEATPVLGSDQQTHTQTNHTGETYGTN